MNVTAKRLTIRAPLNTRRGVLMIVESRADQRMIKSNKEKHLFYGADFVTA